MDECVKNMVKKLRTIPKDMNNGKKNTLNAQFNIEKYFHEIYNTKNDTRQKKYQNQYFCNQKYI